MNIKPRRSGGEWPQVSARPWKQGEKAVGAVRAKFVARIAPSVFGGLCLNIGIPLSSHVPSWSITGARNK